MATGVGRSARATCLGRTTPRARRVETGQVEEWEVAPESQHVAGYELELSHVNALLGPQPWKKAYRGRDGNCVTGALGGRWRGQGSRAGVQARGAWSPSRRSTSWWT